MNKFFFIVIFHTCLVMSGQDLSDEMKSFSTIIVNQKISNKNKLSLTYSGISDIPSFKYTYHQIGLAFGHKMAKNDWLAVNIDQINILQRNDNSYRNYFRFGMEYSHSKRWSKFDLDHEFGGEIFLPAFAKYQYRWTYDFSVTYRKSFTKFKIRPFTSFRLYYYSGGNLANYYDNEGELLAIKAPNDIHRWRFYLGFKTRLFKSMNLNVSYMHNEEFNASLNRYSDINIYNRTKTAVRLPFNSYNAIVLSVIYNLKLTKKKKSDNTFNEADGKDNE